MGTEFKFFQLSRKFFFTLALQNRQVPSPQGGERSTKRKPSRNLPCALSFLGVFVAAHCPPALGATVPTPRAPNQNPTLPHPRKEVRKSHGKGGHKNDPPPDFTKTTKSTKLTKKNRRNRRNRRKYLTKSTKLTNENNKNEAPRSSPLFRRFRRFCSSISSFSSIFFVDFVDFVVFVDFFVDFVDFLSSISSFSSIFFVDFVDLKKFHGKLFGVFRRIRGQLWHCSLAVFLRSPLSNPPNPPNELPCFQSCFVPGKDFLGDFPKSSPHHDSMCLLPCIHLYQARTPFFRTSFLCLCPRCAFRYPPTSLAALRVNFVTSFPASLVLFSLATILSTLQLAFSRPPHCSSQLQQLPRRDFRC